MGLILTGWLRPGLSPEGYQKILRWMLAPLSMHERPGYIYLSQVKSLNLTSLWTDELDSKGMTLYKVGRSKNVKRRINEWNRKCRSSSSYLLEYFPKPSVHSPPSIQSRDKRITRTVLCVCPRRVERLILSELTARFGKLRYVCECDTVHTELFMVQEQDVHQIKEIMVNWVNYAMVEYGELVI